MPEYDYVAQVLIILAAAVVAVPLVQRLGFSPVIGYLVAGFVIGPSGLSLVADTPATHFLAELGVVFLLFAVGLDLPLGRIRLLRTAVFGLGGGQVLLTTLAIGTIVVLLGEGLGAAFAIGGALAMSSTGVVLRLLSERHMVATRFGRATLGVLLMQDLAVGPFLIAILALGQGPSSIAAALGLAGIKAVIAIAGVLGLGRYLLPMLFWPVAQSRNPDIFVALAILVVLAAGLATQLAALSMGFGALLAGMLLAETRYRHQIAAEIGPFRGLLLGLFFMTVGMSTDLDLLGRETITVAVLVGALVIGKASLIAGLATAIMLPAGQAVYLGLLLSQGSEFAFVLLGAAAGTGLVPRAEAQLLALVVAVTMVVTPGLAAIGRYLARRIERRSAPGIEHLSPDDEDLRDHVVIAGFGRVGSAIAQRLAALGRPYVGVDHDPARVIEAASRGLPVYYGDASRADVLEALRVDRARAVVIALDNRRAAIQLAATIRYIFPGLPVFARAYDEAHAEELRKTGATAAVPEPVAIGEKLAASLLAADARGMPGDATAQGPATPNTDGGDPDGSPPSSRSISGGP